MVTKVPRRLLILAAAPLVGLFAGCGGGGDNVKIADAPVYTPPAKPEPPKDIPNRAGQGQYGANKKYQDAMERAARR